MRVKRLEIQGFKSFKDKTVVHFDHNITGIVGPNGCGKSNIVDAFFWVMGEQSYKHMRGNGSADLIFNGSSKYNAAGTAEATLVMETEVVDTENGPTGASSQDIPVTMKTKEVSVTRRVYRSGEGEYFINGVPARLKDIHELFMDTGVGAKGYSVIEQGQIGKIVQAKPEDRRLIIEEAAGIAKYKARKKESLRKLEATQDNLSRLNDVIQEIERNLGSLERQAQKAKQYKKLKEELFDKEMTWGRRKVKVLRQRLDELQARRTVLEQELVILKAELQIAENTIETERVDQVTDSKAAESLQSEIQELVTTLTREKSALDLSRRRQGDLASQLESLEQERGDLNTLIATEREKVIEQETISSTAQESLDTLQSSSGEQEAQVRAARQTVDALRRKLENEQRDLLAGIHRANELTSKQASLGGKVEAANEQIQKLLVQATQLNERLEATRAEVEEIRTRTEERKIERDSLCTERKSLTDRVQTLEQEEKTLQRSREEANRAFTQTQSRLQSLEELAQAHEGMGDGPKTVLEWVKSQGLSGEIKALTDGLDVENGYESALEGWLESGLEALIASEPAKALAALNHLSEKKQGRAALHLAGFAPQRKPSVSADAVAKQLTQAGLKPVGPLSQFVHANTGWDSEFKSVITDQIAPVFVVESLAHVAAADFCGWNLVDQKGIVLEAGGLLRGGSLESDSSASLLGRKRVMAELKQALAADEEKLKAAEVQLEAHRTELSSSRERAQGLQQEVQTLEVTIAGAERDLHQVTRTLKDLEAQIEQNETDQDRMQSEMARAESEQRDLEAKIEMIVNERHLKEGSLADGEADLLALTNSLRTQEDALQDLKIEEASVRERAQSLRRELESTKNMLRDRERRMADIDRLLDRASREREEHSGGDSGLSTKIEELTRALSERQGQLSEVKNRLEETGAKLKGALEKIKTLHSEGDRKSTENNSVSIEIEKLSAEVNHLVLNLEEKYGTGCLEQPVTSPIQEEMDDPVVTQEMNAEEEQLLGEDVERLRDRIRRLGEVNLSAIEEFEEVRKRYDHILTEKQDLEHSMDNLQEAIEHINKTSEERFRKAFEAIANRFERLFPIVFGGGSAKLSLLYPEGSTDILEAGVDILAQPPGKKVVNIALLSGGEKALTAVSLIFAIFMVKPSPFCLLDEVDAPLDDANIGKFNALLREMSAKSQFIIITHNKKTMELNDTLYGVTMEEPGVSKLVSIEMR